MNNKERMKALEEFTRSFKEGVPLAEDFISGDLTKDLRNNALHARDLTEDALANQVMKNTGIPIPDKTASRLKQEDFLNRIVDETYPEFKGNPNLTLGGDSSNYLKGKISVKDDGDIIRKVSTALHEGGHKYDDKVLKSIGDPLMSEKNLAKLGKSRNLKEVDPMEIYEMIAASEKARHHANIPNVREGSYGFSNLKNALKGNKIRGLAGPILGGLATAAVSSNASASDFIPLLDQADDVGSSDDDFEIIGEVKGKQGYDNSQARQDRLKMLSSIKGE